MRNSIILDAEMSYTKRPFVLTSTRSTPPTGICIFDENEDGATYQTPKQQSTLHFFFGASKKRPRSITPVSSISTDASTTVTKASTSTLHGTVATPEHTPLSTQQPKRFQQVYLDCGQSDLGRKVCEKCGMLYVPGVTEDVQAHVRICRERCEGILWRTVRGQRVHPMPMDRESRSDSSIVSIHQLPKSQSAFPVALAAVYQEVVQDLGMDERAPLVGYTIWLYLRKQRVVGFVATRPVSEAYSFAAVSQGGGEQPNNDGLSITMDPVSDRSTLPTKKVMLGVAILWTHDRFRHQNIATQLVTAARHHSFFGMVVPVDSLAFSTPTQAGFSFAKKYCNGSDKVLIYQYQIPKDPAPAADKGGKSIKGR